MKVNKFELTIVTISIFLQAFAILKTNSFGISLWVVLMIYVAIKYGVDYKGKSLKQFLLLNIDNIKVKYKDFIVFNIIFILFLLLSFVLNKEATNYMKMIRIEMIIFSGYTYYSYLKGLDVEQIKYMIKNIYIITVVMSIYGFYEYFAMYLKAPLFLNVLRNNPSYNSHTNFYDYGGGWVGNSSRIYFIFSEPSFYGSFIVMLILLFFIIKTKNKGKKGIVISMLVANLGLTLARSAIMEMAYVCGAYIVFLILDKYKVNKVFKRILTSIIILIPILNIVALSISNTYVFHDESSSARTNSVIYYIKDSFKSIKTLVVGNGLGSIQQSMTVEKAQKSIEAFAHNGYVEVLNEMGIIGIVFFVVAIIFLIKGIHNERNKYIAILAVVIPNTFRTNFYVETLLATLILVLFVIEVQDKDKQDLLDF